MTIDDFVMVPREATMEMLDAAFAATARTAPGDVYALFEAGYKAMLSASPQHIGSPLRGADDAQLREAIAAVRMAMDYAYETGLHEFGYDPLAVLEAALSPAPGGSSIPMGVTEWQPIETAPEGRDVLVAGGKFAPMVAVKYGDEWTNVWTFSKSTAPNPTHWLPLPTPPALLKGEGK